jgi:hypothetical protein
MRKANEIAAELLRSRLGAVARMVRRQLRCARAISLDDACVRTCARVQQSAGVIRNVMQETPTLPIGALMLH